MKGEKSIILTVIFILTAVIILSAVPSFTGYGVAEEDKQITIDFNDVNPGSTAQGMLRLELNNDNLIYGKLIIEGPEKEWVSLIEKDYVFLPGEKTEIPVYIHIPEGTEKGEYRAKMIVMSMGDTQEESVLKDQIIYYVLINIQVSSNKIESVEVSSLTAHNAEPDDRIYFKATIKNIGNQEATKRVDIEIFDSNGKLVKQDSINTELIAYEEQKLIYSLENDLEEGDYQMRIRIDESEQSSKFSIKENLITKGEIVYNDVEVVQDYNVHVVTYFKNTGEKIIEPSIKGVVQQEDIVVEEFKTDPQVILPGEYGMFEYTYSREVKGEYRLSLSGISGSVVLDDKEENFFSRGFLSLDSNVYILLAIVLFLLIALHYVFHRKKE
jgi:ABC-type transport system involved in multi-copper enzyme maturation permease subunit